MNKFICWILIMASGLVFTFASRKDVNRGDVLLGDSLTDAEMICAVPFGEDENEAGYREDDPWNSGPESFIVKNGAVKILDSVKDRIIIVTDETVEYVPLSNCVYPVYFAELNDSYYVIDFCSEYIIKENVQGEMLCQFRLPSGLGHEDVYKLETDNNKLKLISNDLVVYSLDEANNTWTEIDSVEIEGSFDSEKKYTSKDWSIRFFAGNNTMPCYLRVSENALYVGIREYVMEVPVIASELTIRRYSSDGDLLGATVVDERNMVSHPTNSVFIDDDGNVYVMHCLEGIMVITKPIFRTEYCSHMTAIRQMAIEVFGEDVTREGSRPNPTPAPLKTREQAQARASEAANYTWTVTASDKVIYTDEPITLPPYIATASPDDVVTGIPYSMGGFLEELTDFEGDRQSNKVTGNINTSSYYRTTGLDCSGFASYCYGLGYKLGTVNYNYYGYYINGSSSNSNANSNNYTNLKPMDYFVKYDSATQKGHIMLFVSIVRSGSFQIYDATRTINGKVAIRSVDPGALSLYKMKSFYKCGGTGSCNMVYEYNSVSHWSYCAYNCGESTSPENHTWTAYHHDEVNHWKECTASCGVQAYLAPHTWTGIKKNATHHWRACTSSCGAKKDYETHNWTAYSYNATKHWHSCTTSGCGYYASAPHNWVQGGLGFICSECGASMSAFLCDGMDSLPAIPYKNEY